MTITIIGTDPSLSTCKVGALHQGPHSHELGGVAPDSGQGGNPPGHQDRKQLRPPVAVTGGAFRARPWPMALV